MLTICVFNLTTLLAPMRDEVYRDADAMRQIACRSRRLLAGPCFQIVYCFLILVLCLPTAGHSQTANFKREVFGGIALGRLSTNCNVLRNSRGVALDVSAGFSGGFGLRDRLGAGFGIEFSRVLNPTPGILDCDDFSEYDQPCRGSGRHGLASYRLVSANLLHHFSTSRFQPYVAGGGGAVWSAGFRSSFFEQGRFAGQTHASISERAWKHTLFVLNVGGGMRIFLSPAISLRPEIRLYDTPLPSERKLRLLRSSIILGYHW